MTAEDALRWAAAEFGDRLCLTCSWQRQSSVLVHMVSELGVDIDVIELDTQILFRETYETRDRLAARYGLRLITQPPRLTLAEQAVVEAPNLWETDPDRCCHIRKVEPLERALEPYDAWITGIRREQSPTRAGAQRVEWSERYGVWKIQPLVDWDAMRVDAYLRVNEIPVNPLHDGATRRSAASPARAPFARTRTSARAAGPARTSSSAGSTLPPPIVRTTKEMR